MDNESPAFDPEATALAFASCSWKAMREFANTDPEGYRKLSEVSEKLRYNVIDQMVDASAAPHAVAITTFAVEFTTMFLAKLVDRAKDTSDEMTRKAGMHNVREAELFAMFAQGIVKMSRQLYELGNERAGDAENNAEEDEEDADNKIVAFVP